MVFQDNLCSISWTTEVQALHHLKHVGIKYHVVRETVDNKVVTVLYTSSYLKLADPLTMLIMCEIFKLGRSWLGFDRGDFQPDPLGGVLDTKFLRWE